jgi:hypothetical protein
LITDFLCGEAHRVAFFTRCGDDGGEAGACRLAGRELIEDVAHRPREDTFNFVDLPKSRYYSK